MRNLKWIQIYPNVFCVHDGQEGVVYSPLQGKVFSVSQQGLGIIEDYLSHDMNPGHQFHSVLEERGFLEPIELPGVNESEIFDPSDLTLSLTSACNLRCIYCYADGGVSPKNLLWETIQASIDLLFHYAIRAGRKYLSISFHGGGEPTVLWKKLVRAVEYANGMLTNEQELSFSLVTNGTLITPEKAKWLASNSFALTVSFDGPEPVQNLQRPKVQGGGSYSDLVKGIKALVQAGVNFSLRATITGNNQHQLVEMVRLAHELGCSSLSVVPFSSTGRGENGIDGVDPQIFVTNY
ncbi:MAG: radical SAM protein, partial [Patescibacteria group bacterium]|nr:radical SAM protein [Patescibacteria group bacterium]